MSMARIVAGTAVEDRGAELAKGPVSAWFLNECRQGKFHEAVRTFCAQQPEFVRAEDVCVESVSPDSVKLVVQCIQLDHESTKPFVAEVRFELDPVSGKTTRT